MKSQFLESQSSVNHDIRFSVWCEAIRRKIRNDMDELILIAGTPGKGKSTLSYWLGLCLDETFDHSRIAMQGEAFIDILNEAPRYGVVINDEPIEGMFSREHSSKPNRAFARWSWIMRGRNLIMLINANEIRWMDPMVRDSRANWIWHIKDHGFATLYKATRPNDLWAEGTVWIPLFNIKYPKITPQMIPDWKTYQAMKHERLFNTDVRRKKQIGDKKQVVEKEKKSRTKPCYLCGSENRKAEQGRIIKTIFVGMCDDCEKKDLQFRAQNKRGKIHPEIEEKVEQIKKDLETKRKAKLAMNPKGAQ